MAVVDGEHEFCIIQDKLLGVQVCTSLDNSDATDWLNEVHPTGISSRWRIDPGQPVVRCANSPATHRHLVYIC